NPHRAAAPADHHLAVRLPIQHSLESGAPLAPYDAVGSPALEAFEMDFAPPHLRLPELGGTCQAPVAGEHRARQTVGASYADSGRDEVPQRLPEKLPSAGGFAASECELGGLAGFHVQPLHRTVPVRERLGGAGDPTVLRGLGLVHSIFTASSISMIGMSSSMR